MSATFEQRPTIYFLPEDVGDVDIGDGHFVPARFRSKRRITGVGDIELVIETSGRQSRVTQLRVAAIDDDGIAGIRLGRVMVQRLLEADVVEMAASRSQAAWDAAFAGGSPADAVRSAATIASRRRVSDDRLAAVLEAYDRGGIDAVREELLVGERQAWRLLKRAREVSR